MSLKCIWLMMSLASFLCNNGFAASLEYMGILDETHPKCCLKDVHMVLYWHQGPLPHPSTNDPEKSCLLTYGEIERDIKEIGFASRVGICCNIVTINQWDGSVKFFRKKMSDIPGIPHTFVILPEIYYALDLSAGGIREGFKCQPHGKEGIVELTMETYEGTSLWELGTGVDFVVDRTLYASGRTTFARQSANSAYWPAGVRFDPTAKPTLIYPGS